MFVCVFLFCLPECQHTHTHSNWAATSHSGLLTGSDSRSGCHITQADRAARHLAMTPTDTPLSVYMQTQLPRILTPHTHVYLLMACITHQCRQRRCSNKKAHALQHHHHAMQHSLGEWATRPPTQHSCCQLQTHHNATHTNTTCHEHKVQHNPHSISTRRGAVPQTTHKRRSPVIWAGTPATNTCN